MGGRIVKASSWLIACGFVVFSTLLMNASTANLSPMALKPQSGAESGIQAGHCSGEPCDGVARGLRAFFDTGLEGLAGNGRACATCHMAEDNFQLSPASVEARFQRLQFERERHPD